MIVVAAAIDNLLSAHVLKRLLMVKSSSLKVRYIYVYIIFLSYYILSTTN